MRIASAFRALPLVFLPTLPISALAADLPSRRTEPVVVPRPLFTWTGLYFGLQAGGEFGKSNTTVFDATTGNGLATTSASSSGFVGGAHIGYLYQFPSASPFGSLGSGAVAGVEVDIDGTTARSALPLGVGGLSLYTNQPVQGSVRGILGATVNRTLFYVTGGAAFDYVRSNYAQFGTNNDNQINESLVGYTVGGGIKYAYTDLLSVRVEYRYTDFGRFGQFPTPAPAFSARRSETDNRVEVGFSYRVAPPTPAPVVARY